MLNLGINCQPWCSQTVVTSSTLINHESQVWRIATCYGVLDSIKVDELQEIGLDQPKSSLTKRTRLRLLFPSIRYHGTLPRRSIGQSGRTAGRKQMKVASISFLPLPTIMLNNIFYCNLQVQLIVIFQLQLSRCHVTSALSTLPSDTRLSWLHFS